MIYGKFIKVSDFAKLSKSDDSFDFLPSSNILECICNCQVSFSESSTEINFLQEQVMALQEAAMKDIQESILRILKKFKEFVIACFRKFMDKMKTFIKAIVNPYMRVVFDKVGGNDIDVIKKIFESNTIKNTVVFTPGFTMECINKNGIDDYLDINLGEVFEKMKVDFADGKEFSVENYTNSDKFYNSKFLSIGNKEMTISERFKALSEDPKIGKEYAVAFGCKYFVADPDHVDLLGVTTMLMDKDINTKAQKAIDFYSGINNQSSKFSEKSSGEAKKILREATKYFHPDNIERRNKFTLPDKQNPNSAADDNKKTMDSASAYMNGIKYIYEFISKGTSSVSKIFTSCLDTETRNMSKLVAISNAYHKAMK